MDKEIKRLLKLDRIPNFNLSKDEKEKLEAWKKAQEPVEIKPKRTYTRKKKTTNEVKEEEKETGALEIQEPNLSVENITPVFLES